jgi:hypothetical protein
MKRSEINKTKKQNNWRQGRDESHCGICISMFSETYDAGFGTRTQGKCKRLEINTSIINTCDLFTGKKL